MPFSCHFLSVVIVTWSEKLAIGEPRKNYPVDKYSEESNGMALFLDALASLVPLIVTHSLTD